MNHEIADAFARHHRIGFQFSGGRDSTAALYYLRPLWDRMTVYTLDTGEMYPETRAVIDAVEEDIHVNRIHSDVEAVRREHGLASDLVPVDNIEVGRWVSGRSLKIISRYDCCARAIMLPMHQRMLDDGVTLIVRGQRDSDMAAPPTRSGDARDGVEVLYPIQNWTDAQVMTYIKANGLPLSSFYEKGKHGSDCMGCTAWWDDGRLPVLRKHPEAHALYVQNMRLIRGEIDRQYAMLDKE